MVDRADQAERVACLRKVGDSARAKEVRHSRGRGTDRHQGTEPDAAPTAIFHLCGNPSFVVGQSLCDNLDPPGTQSWILGRRDPDDLFFDRQTESLEPLTICLLELCDLVNPDYTLGAGSRLRSTCVRIGSVSATIPSVSRSDGVLP